MIFGYMLLAFNLLTLLAFSIGAFALVKQSQAEDLFLANAHKSSHAQWLESTKLVIPGVY